MRRANAITLVQERIPAKPGWARSTYDRYFHSQIYDQRYPHPNPRTLGLIKSHLTRDSHVLDYGAGTGRYTLPLLEAPVGFVCAYDISPVGLTMLAERAARKGIPSERYTVTSNPMDLTRQGGFDIALLLFGVLSMVGCRHEREDTLRLIASELRPEGRIILTVPNALRRFVGVPGVVEREDANPPGLAEVLGARTITFCRKMGTERFDFGYHLFTPASLREELAGAGLVVERMVAESILPECAVTGSRAVAGVDGAVSGIVPCDLGYGLVAICRRA